MESLKFNSIIVFFVILLCSQIPNSHSVYAQTASAPWPKFKHDAGNTGQSLYVGANIGKFKWKYSLLEGVVSTSPIIGPDNTIYFGHDGTLYAFNPNGSLKWKNIIHPGFEGSGTVAIASDGTLYVPLYRMLYAVDSNGTLKWKYQSDNEVAVYVAIGPNGTIYVGSGNDLLAIKPDGNLLWKFRVGEEVRTCPAIGKDGTIYVRGRINYLVALNANGTKKWSIDLGSIHSHTYMSPVIGIDGTIFTYGRTKILSITGDNYIDYNVLYRINPNGTVKGIYDGIYLPESAMTPSIDKDGTIYITASDFSVFKQRLFAITPDGNVKWSYFYENFSSTRSSPAIDLSGNVYFGTSDYHIYALDFNGNFLWKYRTLNKIDSSPAIGKDGTIYFGSYDGYLYAVGEVTEIKDTFPMAPILNLLIDND